MTRPAHRLTSALPDLHCDETCSTVCRTAAQLGRATRDIAEYEALLAALCARARDEPRGCSGQGLFAAFSARAQRVARLLTIVAARTVLSGAEGQTRGRHEKTQYGGSCQARQEKYFAAVPVPKGSEYDARP